MPQGSLFPESELARLEIVLRAGSAPMTTTVQLRGFNRSGAVLASSGVVITRAIDEELIEGMLARSARGFLFRGAIEATVDPASWLKGERRRLSKTI